MPKINTLGRGDFGGSVKQGKQTILLFRPHNTFINKLLLHVTHACKVFLNSKPCFIKSSFTPLTPYLAEKFIGVKWCTAMQSNRDVAVSIWFSIHSVSIMVWYAFNIITNFVFDNTVSYQPNFQIHVRVHSSLYQNGCSWLM
jgi:hypothetical protein